MAITISGENNSDKILASDGVIDQISGFNIVGVVTATSFTGDLTGDVTGNLVGNVTGNINNSTLLLQTGGSERFRITGNNELGIAGANYGTSGQVLTSGGSGSAVTWATPAVTAFTNGSNNRVVTATSGSGLNGESTLTYNGNGTLNVLGASGNTQLALFRTDANTTGTTGTIGFYASDNHAVAGLYALGDGNNEGAHLVFKTTSAASGTSIYSDVEERLRITSDGSLIIGHTAAPFGDGDPLQLVSTSSGEGLIISNYSASDYGNQIAFLKSRSASVGNTILQSGDRIGDLNFYGNDGSGRSLGAQIQVRVSDTPSNNNTPSTIYFNTGLNQSMSTKLMVTPTDVEIRGSAKLILPSSSSGDYVRLYAGSGTGKWDIYGNGAYLRFSDNDSAGSVRIDTRLGTGTAASYAQLVSYVSATGAIPTTGLIQTNNDNHALQLWNGSNSATYCGLMLETRTSGASGWLIANEWKSTYAGDLVFRGRSGGTSSSERLRIDSSGKLGVGDFSSTSISQALHVRGSQPEIYLEHTGGYDMTLTTNDGAGQNGITVNGGYLSLAYNNKNIVMCRTGGNVGINQSSPDQALHITGNQTAIIRLENANAMGQDYIVGAVEFEKQDASGAGAGLCGGMRCHSDDSYGARTYLAFSTRGNSTGSPATDTERFRITAQGGVTFNGDTAYANALNDYEEGTWTPAIQFDVGGSGIVYGTRYGRYRKIGNMVHLTYYMQISSGVSSSDYFARLSLPFNGFGGAVGHQDARIRQWNTGVSDWFVSLGGSAPVFFMSNGNGSGANYARGDDINGYKLSGQYTLYVS